MGLDYVGWIRVAQDRQMCCEYGDEHKGSIKRGEFLDKMRTCDFSRKRKLHEDKQFS